MVGSKIKQYLTENGIKIKFLADKTGISQGVIYSICRDETKINIVDYFKICEALGLSADYFREED